LQPLSHAHDAPWLHKALHPDAQIVTLRVPRQGKPGTRTEAELACELLLCAHRCWPPGGQDFAKGVAVVAPHHHQIAALRQKLSAAGISANSQPRINTVEKMQGQEAELVLILYGLTDAEAISAEASFMYAPRRLNVATTRARCKTVMLLSAAMEEGAALDANSLTAPVAEGLAFVRRYASVCRAGSAWAATPAGERDVTAGAHIKGARYVKVFQPAAGHNSGTQRSDPPGSTPIEFSDMRNSLEDAEEELMQDGEGDDDDGAGDQLPAASSDGQPDDDADDPRMQMEQPPAAAQVETLSPVEQSPVFDLPPAAAELSGAPHSAPPVLGLGDDIRGTDAARGARRQLLSGGGGPSLMDQVPRFGSMVAPGELDERPFLPRPSAAPVEAPQRRKNACGKCGEVGHNVRTCPELRGWNT
jgi:hypothetical protein